MRSDRVILLALAAVAAAALAVLAIAGRTDRQDVEQVGSTYSAAPQGTRAWAETLRRAGVPVVQLERRDLPTLPGDVLVILEPQGLSKVDALFLEQRIKDGAHVLVVAGGNTFYKHFEIEIDSARPGHPVPVFPSVVASGVTDIEIRRRDRLDTPGAFTPLFGDTDGAVVATARFGKGRLTVASDLFPFSNDGLPRGDHLRLANNLVSDLLGTDGRVLFDEHHHGFSHARTPIAYLSDAGLAPAFYFALLLGGLWLLSRAARLGPPLALNRPERRTAAEYVDSLATVLAAGRSRHYPLRALYRDLRRRAADTLGVPPKAEAERLFATLKTRNPRAATVVYRAARQAEDLLAASDFDDRALLDAAQAIAEARTHLEGLTR